MTISLIAAVSENNVIGKNNDLIWHISEDLKRFKNITKGHCIVMGRKTYESLPVKPLPFRKNIVISEKTDNIPGATVVKSPEEVVKMCKEEDEIFICGGESVYKAFLPLADKMYITKVYKSFDGDTFFPNFNEDDWLKINTEDVKKDEKSGLEYSFTNLLKI